MHLPKPRPYLAVEPVDPLVQLLELELEISELGGRFDLALELEAAHAAAVDRSLQPLALGLQPLHAHLVGVGVGVEVEIQVLEPGPGPGLGQGKRARDVWGAPR